MDPKSKFKNVSGGVAGAIQLNHEGKAAGVPVFPGESIWLTEQEEILTANAPRNESDNPFTNGTFELEVRAEQAAHARPIGSSKDAAPAADPQPDTPAVEGADPEGIDLRTEAGAANESPEQPPAASVAEAEAEAAAAAAEEPGLPTGAPPEPEGAPIVGRRAETEESAEVQAAAAAPQTPPPASPEPKEGESKRAARQRAPQPQTATPAPAPARPAPAAPSE